MRITAFLQNAWSPVYAGRKWPRKQWLQALNESRSGQRLRVFFGALCKDCRGVHVDNTTPIVGEAPDSVVPPDPEYIRAVVRETDPAIIVTLGRQARDAVDALYKVTPRLSLPHPASRTVTNDLYLAAGRLLSGRFQGRLELRQRRGFVEIVP